MKAGTQKLFGLRVQYPADFQPFLDKNNIGGKKGGNFRRVKIGLLYINNMADLQQSYPDPETFPRGSHPGSVTNDLV